MGKTGGGAGEARCLTVLWWVLASTPLFHPVLCKAPGHPPPQQQQKWSCWTCAPHLTQGEGGAVAGAVLAAAYQPGGEAGSKPTSQQLGGHRMQAQRDQDGGVQRVQVSRLPNNRSGSRGTAGGDDDATLGTPQAAADSSAASTPPPQVASTPSQTRRDPAAAARRVPGVGPQAAPAAVQNDAATSGTPQAAGAVQASASVDRALVNVEACCSNRENAAGNGWSRQITLAGWGGRTKYCCVDKTGCACLTY